MRATAASLVHSNVGPAEPAQVHVVRDDDDAVLRPPHVELQHVRAALGDGAPEPAQGVLVGLGRAAPVGDVDIAAAPLLDQVNSETQALPISKSVSEGGGRGFSNITQR